MRRTLTVVVCTAAILTWWFSQDLYVRAQDGGSEAAENGDVNGDLSRDIADAVYLLNWIFEGGPEPVPIAGAASPDSTPRVIDCDCDAGQTLAEALARARSGDTIRLSGTCTEQVTVTTDRITLDGGGTAIVDGGGGGGEPTEFDGVITVDGARGVKIKGLTIRNGTGEGIFATHGAVLAVSGTTVEDIGGAGIALDNSAADLTDCTLQRNLAGMDMFRLSTAVLKGAINAVDNNGPGIVVNSQSMLELRGATVHCDNNSTGLFVDHSTAGIYGFDASQGSTITANGNSGDGIVIPNGYLVVYGSSHFGSGANTISASNNGAAGIWLPGWGKIASPFATAKFVIENNAIGLNFADDSGAVIIGGLSVRNNVTGVLADGAGPLTFVSVEPNPSVIENNETDVDLLFGSRLTAGGAPLGPVQCDGTALIRGSAVCP